jgi:hypothetical protein
MYCGCVETYVKDFSLPLSYIILHALPVIR